MWSCAQINKSSASVSSDFATFWDLSSDQRNLEWVASEKSKRFFLGQDKSSKGLGGGNDFGSGLFDIFVVFFSKYTTTRVGIVEESFFSWWSMTKLHSVLLLEGLSQDMSR